MSGRFRVAAAAALACTATTAAVPAARADRTQLSVFQDDRSLVLASDASRERTLDDLLSLGADTIHSVVFWNRVAPYPNRTHRPRFDAADPAAYPATYWDRYDGLVRGAVARGMDLILSPAGPLPLWASRCRTASRATRRSCRPDLTQFKRFVQALGRRYSGEYADENQGGGVLPRVSRWSVWNEPNQGGWLQPQYGRVGGRVELVAPGIYRDLVRAAVTGLRASGHGSDDILMGETAPIGRVTGPLSSRPIPPGDFWRGLLCVDRQGRPLQGLAAAALGCAHFRRLPVTGVSHHPYTRGGSRPPTDPGGPNEITISSSGRLKSILRAGARAHRIRSGLGIWYTEFGFQTDPPDRLFGVSLDRQSAFLNQADWIAWRDPQVKAVAQYELRDEPDLAAFQTGLEFRDGRHKPGFDAYRLPLWVSRAGARLRVWGQLRPAEDNSVETVDVQNAAPGSTDFRTVAEVQVANLKGFFVTTVARAPGSWRLSWTPADGGPTLTSRIAQVAPR